MTVVTYLLLVKVLFRDMPAAIPGGREWIQEELTKLGRLSRGEWIVLWVFLAAALAWCFGPLLRSLEIGGTMPLKPLTDSVIAMTAGILLFIIPVDYKKGVHALDWASASGAIAWDVLLLFGGGLSMAAAIQSTGAADVVGACALSLSGLPEWGITAGVTFIATMASEVTSNTALAATMMPLVSAAASSLSLDPEGLLIAATIGTSLAKSRFRRWYARGSGSISLRLW